MGWTVKVDADAVFVPSRLQNWLSDKSGESPHGIYFENCKNVQYGFFGNLEVMSNEATSVLTTYLEDCHAVYAPCAYDGCDWKYGAWERTCTSRGAWTGIMWTRSKPLTSLWMVLARQTAQQTRRRTRNGTPRIAVR